jgi:hypothetical protein
MRATTVRALMQFAALVEPREYGEPGALIRYVERPLP